MKRQIMEQNNQINMHKLYNLKPFTFQEYSSKKYEAVYKSKLKLWDKIINIAHKMWVLDFLFVIGISRFLRKILGSLQMKTETTGQNSYTIVHKLCDLNY